MLLETERSSDEPVLAIHCRLIMNMLILFFIPSGIMSSYHNILFPAVIHFLFHALNSLNSSFISIPQISSAANSVHFSSKRIQSVNGIVYVVQAQVRIPEELLEKIDEWIEESKYNSRSEAIKYVLMLHEEKERPESRKVSEELPESPNWRLQSYL